MPSPAYVECKKRARGVCSIIGVALFFESMIDLIS
jgi:hypothetical protein